MTVDDHYNAVQSFPFIVSYNNLFGDHVEHAIVGRYKVGTRYSYLTDNGFNISGSIVCILEDYLPKDNPTLSDNASTGTYTQSFSWQQPAECKTCAPYWTRCNCER